MRLFAGAFAVIVVAAVLTLEQVMVHPDSLRFTLVGFWITALLVISLLQKKAPKRNDTVELLVLAGVFTGVLVAILFGIQRLEIPLSWQHHASDLFLFFAVVGLILFSRFRANRSPSHSDFETSQEDGNPK